MVTINRLAPPFCLMLVWWPGTAWSPGTGNHTCTRGKPLLSCSSCCYLISVWMERHLGAGTSPTYQGLPNGLLSADQNFIQEVLNPPITAAIFVLVRLLEGYVNTTDCVFVNYLNTFFLLGTKHPVSFGNIPKPLLFW